MQIQIPTNDLKAALRSVLATALTDEQALGQAAQSQLERLVDELLPLVGSETQALLTATNPAVPRAYLDVLQGCVAAAVAKLGLAALQDQRAALALIVHASIQMLALALRAAIIA